MLGTVIVKFYTFCFVWLNLDEQKVPINEERETGGGVQCEDKNCFGKYTAAVVGSYNSITPRYSAFNGGIFA